MTTFSLRGLDPLTISRIKAVARRRKVSVNRLIVETLRDYFHPRPGVYDDLDGFAGTWTAAQAAGFDRAVADFGRIDQDMWAPAPRLTHAVKTAKTGKAVHRKACRA